MFGDLFNDIKNAISGVVGGVQHALGINSSPQAPTPQPTPVVHPATTGIAGTPQIANPGGIPGGQFNIGQLANGINQSQQSTPGAPGTFTPTQQAPTAPAKPQPSIEQRLKGFEGGLYNVSTAPLRAVMGEVTKNQTPGVPGTSILDAIGMDVPAARAPEAAGEAVTAAGKVVNEAKQAAESAKQAVGTDFSGLHNAANDLFNFYKEAPGKQTNVNELMSGVTGAEQRGKILSNNLDNEVTKVLPNKNDLNTVTHVLDGTLLHPGARNVFNETPPFVASSSKLTEAGSQRDLNLPLSEVIQNDKLFTDYPDLKNVQVKTKDLGSLDEGQTGGYSHTQKTITIPRLDHPDNPVKTESPETRLNSLIHEVTHAVQDQQGRLDTGDHRPGAVGQLEYRDHPNEVEARQAVADAQPLRAAKASPEVQEVSRTLGALNAIGFDIRSHIVPDLGEVSRYSPRILIKSGQRGAKALMDSFDPLSLDSGHNISRQINKYVGPDGGEKIGKPEDLGLKQLDDGTAIDKDGNIFQPRKATIAEINGNTKYQFDTNAARVANRYHADTTRLATRANALDELVQNAKHYGLVKGEAPGYVPIHNIPELGGYSADAKTAKAIENKFKGEKTNAISQTWQGINRPLVQSIVINPVQHGIVNMGSQALLALTNLKAGGLKVIPAAGRMMNPDYAKNVFQEMLKEGKGHLDDYGGHTVSKLSNFLQRNGIPEFNKVNARATEGMVNYWRGLVYDTYRHNNMDPRTAVNEMNKFFEDDKRMSSVAKNAGEFWRYHRSMLNTGKELTTHPLKNIGALGIGVPALVGLYYGFNKALQDVTGNPNAHGPIGGVVGTAKQVAAAPGQIKQGEVPFTSYANPGTQVIANQLAGKNLALNETLRGPSQRAQDALNTGLSPAGTTEKLMGGSRSPLETLANEFSTYLPHAKGAPAAPKIPAFNTPNAEPAAIGSDKTGYSQEQSYFKMNSAVLNSLNPSSKAYDIAKNYFDSAYVNGQKASEGTVGSHAQAVSFLTSDGQQALKAIYSQEHTQANADPLWKLPLTAPKGQASVTAYMQYSAQQEGWLKTGAKIALEGMNAVQSGNGWLDKLDAARTAFYGQLPPSTKAAAGEPPYPTFSAQQQADMTAGNKIANSTQYEQFLDAHPDVVEAQNSIVLWENQINHLEGFQGSMPASLTPSPQLAQAMQTYDSLPPSKSSGNPDSATNGERSNWIKANPAEYNAISSYLAQATGQGMLKSAVEAYASGQNLTSQTLLKDASEMGQDVAKTGTGTSASYSINPALAYTESGGGGSSSGSADQGAPHLRPPSVKLVKFKTGGSRPKSVKLKFQVPRSKPVKRIAPTEAPPIRQAAPKNSGIKTSNDVVKST